MADLAALLLLLATGWWDGALARLGVGRGLALAAGALALAAAWINVGLDGQVPLRFNVAGTLPVLAVVIAPWVAPSWGTRLSAAAAVAACFLFGLSSWTGTAAAIALPVIAGAAAVAVAGTGPVALLAAGAAPALADLARWAVAWADGLPGTIWVGGGSSFATAVLAVTAAGLMVAARSLPPLRLARSTVPGRRDRLG